LSKIKSFQIHDRELYVQNVVMQGPYVFSVGSDKALRVWELEVTSARYHKLTIKTGKQLYRIEAHEDVVYDIALDGDKIYTCSGDGITIIYDLQSIFVTPSISYLSDPPRNPIFPSFLTKKLPWKSSNHVTY
jgi:WD40 repeat protein